MQIKQHLRMTQSVLNRLWYEWTIEAPTKDTVDQINYDNVGLCLRLLFQDVPGVANMRVSDKSSRADFFIDFKIAQLSNGSARYDYHQMQIHITTNTFGVNLGLECVGTDSGHSLEDVADYYDEYLLDTLHENAMTEYIFRVDDRKLTEEIRAPQKPLSLEHRVQIKEYWPEFIAVQESAASLSLGCHRSDSNGKTFLSRNFQNSLDQLNELQAKITELAAKLGVGRQRALNTEEMEALVGREK